MSATADPRRADPEPAAGTLADFGPAEFLMEPLPAPPGPSPDPQAGQPPAFDPFAAVNAMSPAEKIALFT